LIDSPDQKKDCERDDEETNDGIDEKTVVNGYGSCSLGGCERLVGACRLWALFKHDKKIRKIDIPEKQTDGWHNHVCDQ